MTDADVDIPSGGEKDMAVAEENVMQAVLTGMATAAAAASESRTRRFDQLAEDSAAMWSINMTTPTVFAGMGFRVAQQHGGWPDPGNPPGAAGSQTGG